MGDPTVRRRQLGSELRRLRESMSMKLEQAATRTSMDGPKLSRIETARLGVKPSDLDALLDLYEVTDPARREVLHRVARDGSKRGWWQTYRDQISPVYADLISLEDDAAYSRVYETVLIPGMLQTAAYARASIAAINLDDPPDRTESLVAVRQARQSVLTRPRPLEVHAVIHEAALRHTVGDNMTMRDQLQRLVDLSGRPHITVQVLPIGAPHTPGLAGGFTLIGWGAYDLDVVLVESLTSALYVEDTTEVRKYDEAFGRISDASLTPDDSADLIVTVKDSIQ